MNHPWLAAILLCAPLLHAAEAMPPPKQDAALLRHTFEQALQQLPPRKQGHYGLRLYRQTGEEVYGHWVLNDLEFHAQRLNRLFPLMSDPAGLARHIEARVERYSHFKQPRGQLRYDTVRLQPEYLILGFDLIASLARLQEYGLRHQGEDAFRRYIEAQQFERFVTQPEMIQAWAAQLANQVFWLKQLGQGDMTELFIEAFRKVYPDDMDAALDELQYHNKLYGLTHILFASSQYYQYPVRPEPYRWIFDYFRANEGEILRRAKADVLAEVGIAFLLAGLDSEPMVARLQSALQATIDRDAGMIPSTTGSLDPVYGEHRNVLAIMLLDWQGMHPGPDARQLRRWRGSLPEGVTIYQPHLDTVGIQQGTPLAKQSGRGAR
ncbi:DUF3541 domain-containing protein [Ferrimonas marina]|uniref:DUF3541 domain-containing protein n=1 Tax=Ferrimonas marina TaxID=299255 RepID=A0A1M5NML4_9GAMM|nr:DUF3541 domain-containing protein [Ferrimonas marina]SHG90183.1 protein of unknown function [Ferrimonas marina]